MMFIIDRLLLLICAVICLLLSAGGAVLYFKAVSEEFLVSQLAYVSAQPEFIAGCAAVLLISLRLLKVAVSFKRSEGSGQGEVMLIKNDIGEVEVTVGAIRNLVQKTAEAVPGVRTVKVGIDNGGQEAAFLKVRLEVVMGREVSVQDVSGIMGENVRAALEDIAGIHDSTVEIVIADINNSALAKGKRVV